MVNTTKTNTSKRMKYLGRAIAALVGASAAFGGALVLANPAEANTCNVGAVQPVRESGTTVRARASRQNCSGTVNLTARLYRQRPIIADVREASTTAARVNGTVDARRTNAPAIGDRFHTHATSSNGGNAHSATFTWNG
jgi:hypothetical protein